jgi:Zn-dependent protease
VLFVLLKVSPDAKIVMRELIFGGFNFSAVQGGGLITPMLAILYLGLWLNLILAFFNLLPLPPLDGSHLVRHLLPTNALRVYDQLGIVFLIVIFFFGGRLIYVFVGPILGSINMMLLAM